MRSFELGESHQTKLQDGWNALEKRIVQCTFHDGMGGRRSFACATQFGVAENLTKPYETLWNPSKPYETLQYKSLYEILWILANGSHQAVTPEAFRFESAKFARIVWLKWADSVQQACPNQRVWAFGYRLPLDRMALHWFWQIAQSMLCARYIESFLSILLKNVRFTVFSSSSQVESGKKESNRTHFRIIGYHICFIWFRLTQSEHSILELHRTIKCSSSFS